MADTGNEQNWKGIGLAIEKLTKEPHQAYEAFLQYAWLQYAERTVARVVKITGLPEFKIQAWFRAFDWQDRASLVDGMRWNHEFRQREAVLSKDNEKFAEMNRSIKERGLAMSTKMLAVAEKLLGDAEISGNIIETDRVTTADGRSVPLMTQINMKAKISDIPRLASTALLLARAIQDLPTEVLDQHKPLPIGDYSELSLEELEAMRSENRQQLALKSGISKVDDSPDLLN